MRNCFDGFLAADHQPLHRQVLLRQFFHALLYAGEVFRGKAVTGGEIVIKAVLDHRADGDLHPGEQLLHRHGQQVGSGVADDFQPRIIALGNNREPGVLLDDERGIHFPLIDHAPKRSLGKAGTYIGGDIVNSNGIGE